MRHTSIDLVVDWRTHLSRWWPSVSIIVVTYSLLLDYDISFSWYPE